LNTCKYVPKEIHSLQEEKEVVEELEKEVEVEELENDEVVYCPRLGIEQQELQR